MAHLHESSRWTPAVYLISRNDPRMAGEFGINNVQATQLACRTQFLLERFLSAHGPEGDHALTGLDVADGARLPESAFDFPYLTRDLHTRLSGLEADFDGIVRALNNVASTFGTEANALYRALRLSWEYSGASFDFCLFNPLFDYADTPPTRILDATQGDTSADVESTAGIATGDTFVLTKPGETPCVASVAQVLDEHRVVFASALPWSAEAADLAELGKTSWSIASSAAHVEAGGILLSKRLDNLIGHAAGFVSIRHQNQAVPYTVQYRASGSEPWSTAAQVLTTVAEYRGDTWFDTRFAVPGGQSLYLKITSGGSDVVDCMSSWADTAQDNALFIRTPVAYENFCLSRFGGLYRDTPESLRVTISESETFEPGTTTKTVTLGNFGNDTFKSMFYVYGQTPVTYKKIRLMPAFEYSIEEGLFEYELVPGHTYFWCASYESASGRVSEPSNTASFVYSLDLSDYNPDPDSGGDNLY